MASAAAVLFVKNDADDIGWWIAYHLAIGFNAVIIYDDHSTDGTWDIIQNAAGLYPVEAHRADRHAGTSHAQRRSNAFAQAMEACRTRFDWVICLDSDEYVYFDDHDDIGRYLDGFADADAIMLNWSVFGSNGHIGRPAQGPIAAYTKRAELDFPDHRAGKTFLRPGAYTGHFVDGCHFTLDPSRHVHADGTAFDPARAASWQGARILHYVTRNLTHYTRRLARLGAGQSAPDLWSHYNRNDVQDLAAQRFRQATRQVASRLWRSSLEALYWRLQKDIKANSLSFLPETAFTVREHRSLAMPCPLHFATLSTESGETLVYDPETHGLVPSPAASSHEQSRIVLVTEASDLSSRASQTGFLLLPPNDTAPLDSGDCLTRWIPVDITAGVPAHRDDSFTQQDEQRVTLHADGQVMARMENGQIGFTGGTPLALYACTFTPDTALETRLRPYLALRGHGNSLHDFCTGIDLLRAPQPDAMACALASLSNEARAVLGSRYSGFLPPWMYAA